MTAGARDEIALRRARYLPAGSESQGRPEIARLAIPVTQLMSGPSSPRRRAARARSIEDATLDGFGLDGRARVQAAGVSSPTSVIPRKRPRARERDRIQGGRRPAWSSTDHAKHLAW